MEGRNYSDKIEELRSQMEEIRQHLVSNPQPNWSTGALDDLKANLNELGAAIETERRVQRIGANGGEPRSQSLCRGRLLSPMP